jgi:hypothetical protein
MLQVHTLEIRLTLKAPEPPYCYGGQLEYSPAPLGFCPEAVLLIGRERVPTRKVRRPEERKATPGVRFVRNDRS